MLHGAGQPGAQRRLAAGGAGVDEDGGAGGGGGGEAGVAGEFRLQPGQRAFGSGVVFVEERHRGGGVAVVGVGVGVDPVAPQPGGRAGGEPQRQLPAGVGAVGGGEGDQVGGDGEVVIEGGAEG